MEMQYSKLGSPFRSGSFVKKFFFDCLKRVSCFQRIIMNNTCNLEDYNNVNIFM